MKEKTETKFNLIKDRVEIYKDFTINLIHYIYEYYLDRETLNNGEDIYNHFLFCYNKTCADFLNEEIDFRENVELVEYFYEYFYYQFYTSETETEINYFINFWNSVFNIEGQKNKNFIKVLVETYQIFNTSIANEKKYLELV